MTTAELERYADYLECLARHLHEADHGKLNAIAEYLRGKTNIRMKSAPPLTDYERTTMRQLFNIQIPVTYKDASGVTHNACIISGDDLYRYIFEKPKPMVELEISECAKIAEAIRFCGQHRRCSKECPAYVGDKGCFTRTHDNAADLINALVDASKFPAEQGND